MSVLIADGPALEFDHVYLYIDRVSLIPGGDQKPVVVFEGSEKIDLLEYRDKDFLLASGSEVPAGRYEKIRLEISKIEVDPSTECPEVKLPSGKIDLNPRGAFDVSENGSILVRIDIDAKKSISIHEAGNSGKCIFRPVVFVEILSGPPPACRQEVSGIIESILTPAEDAKEAQQKGHEGNGDDDEDDDDTDDDDHVDGSTTLAILRVKLGEGGGIIQVAIEQNKTAIFNAEANPADFGIFKVDDPVLARGQMISSDRIQATWVIQGKPEDLHGSFGTAIVEGKFTFKTDVDLQGRTTTGTLAFAACDAPVALDSILAGQPARLLGAAATEGDVAIIRAAVIDVGPWSVRGDISAIDTATGEVTVMPASGDAVTFKILPTTEIVLVGDGSLTVDDLRVGQTVEVDIDIALGAATRIAVEPEEASGTVQALDAAARTFELVPAPSATAVAVTVATNATVILIQAADSQVHQVDLSELKDGDAVVLFGLVPEVGKFIARTVVIRR